mgnify:FL=1
MTRDDLEGLAAYLERYSSMSDAIRDLISDALWAGAGTYRCESDLRALIGTLKAEGHSNLVPAVERLL